MNIMTLNIRGLGEKHKVDWVPRLRNLYKLCMICIQESKLGELSPPLNITECWGDNNWGFEQVFTTGRSGGLVLIWDKGAFTLIDTFKSRYFILTLGNLVGINGLTGIINIYGPQSSHEKSKLWNELLSLKSSILATWILMGDFNVVRRPEERINSVCCPISASVFNQFIYRGEFIDLKMGGQRFTFFKTQGAKLSKLDRILVCNHFSTTFPLASCEALDRDLSDHSPIVLRTRGDDFGPPPFKLYNSWM